MIKNHSVPATLTTELDARRAHGGTVSYKRVNLDTALTPDRDATAEKLQELYAVDQPPPPPIPKYVPRNTHVPGSIAFRLLGGR